MDKITHVQSYYRQPKMLDFQVENWLSWPREVKEQINFIVVDDGSPEPIVPPKVNLNLAVYRINENILWNCGGARNLGAHLCETEWMWLNYLDYYWTEENVKKMLLLDRTDPMVFYRFHCVYADSGLSQRPEHHPIGAPYLNKETFWRQGGLDEDFSGHYGAEDCAMYWQLTRDPGGCKEVILDDPKILCYTPANGPSDATIDEKKENPDEGWTRNNSRNRALLGDKRQKRVPWSRSYLRFTWQEVYRSYLS